MSSRKRKHGDQDTGEPSKKRSDSRRRSKSDREYVALELLDEKSKFH